MKWENDSDRNKFFHHFVKQEKSILHLQNSKNKLIIYRNLISETIDYYQDLSRTKVTIQRARREQLSHLSDSLSMLVKEINVIKKIPLDASPSPDSMANELSQLLI
jgi:ribosomal protein L30E